MESAALMKRWVTVWLSSWVLLASGQSPFESLWGEAWHDGPWLEPVVVEGVNSTAHEVMLGADPGGLIVGQMHVQFGTQWWEQLSDWKPLAGHSMLRPDRIVDLKPMLGSGLQPPAWPGLGEVTHWAYDQTHTWAVLSAYRDEQRADVDLFLAILTADGWSEPRPLDGLNTEYNEVFPNWIGGRLVFGSDRPGGEGGFDLYVSDRLNSFQAVDHLPPPLNGPGDDVAALGTKWGWYVGSTRKGGQGGLDVWWVARENPREMEVQAKGLEVRLLREDGLPWSGAHLAMRRLSGALCLDEVMGETATVTLASVPQVNGLNALVESGAEERGFLEVWTAEGERILRLPVASGVAFVLHLMSLEAIGASHWSSKEDASAWPAPFKEVQVLFQPGSYELDEVAAAELLRWWKRWTSGSKVEGFIRVMGHADSTGIAERNEFLSLRRAEAVEDWLVSHGAPAESIAVESWSDQQPLSSQAWAVALASQPEYAGRMPCERRVAVFWESQ